MIQKRHMVKIPKQGIFNISIIILAGIIGLIFMINLFLSDGGTSTGKIFATFITGLVISFGLIFPILLYLKTVKNLMISDAELTIINRFGKERLVLKSNIKKIVIIKDIIDKNKIFIVYYDKDKPGHGFALDMNSGKQIWNWYHNQGEWEKEVKQSENTPTSGEK